MIPLRNISAQNWKCFTTKTESYTSPDMTTPGSINIPPLSFEVIYPSLFFLWSALDKDRKKVIKPNLFNTAKTLFKKFLSICWSSFYCTPETKCFIWINVKAKFFKVLVLELSSIFNFLEATDNTYSLTASGNVGD